MQKRLPVLIAAAWAAAVPFLADAVGARLGVTTAQELADHVAPAAAALAGAALVHRPAGAALVFLGGLFVTTAHVPLLWDGAPAAATLLHLAAGPPLLVLGLLLVIERLRPPAPRPPRA